MSDETPTRRDLIEAQRAIFRNQDEDERMGVDWETDEYLDLHDKFWTMHRQAGKPERKGVWDEALAERERERDGWSSHPFVEYGRNHGGVWWHSREAER